MLRFFKSDPAPQGATPAPATPVPEPPQKPTGQVSQKRIRAILVVTGIGVLFFLVSTGQTPKATGSSSRKQPESATQQNPAAIDTRDYATAVTQALKPNTPDSPTSQFPFQSPGPVQYSQYPASSDQQPPAAWPPPYPGSTLAATGPGLYGAPNRQCPSSTVPPGSSQTARDTQQETRDAVEATNYKREVDSLAARLIVRSDRVQTGTGSSSSATQPVQQSALPNPADAGSGLSSPAGQGGRSAPAQPTRPAGPDESSKSGQPSNLPADIPSHDSRAQRHDQSVLNRADGPLFKLFEGAFIETVLTNRLNSSFTGPVECMVTIPVWSHNRAHLLIPQGTKVLGEARRVTATGQQRIAVLFHRLIMPDGYSVSLDRFTGLNQIGETGLTDRVNHHYLQLFGVSAALGAISGLAVRGTNYSGNTSGGDAFRQGFSQELSREGAQILDHFLNVLPTVTIREGIRVKVYLVDDVSLPAYDQHRMPSNL